MLRSAEVTAREGRQRGFTLIELLVVLALLALVAALAGPRVARMGGLGVQGAAETVAGLLREARSRAIVTNTAVPVTLDTGRRAVSAPGLRTVTLPETVSMTLLVARIERESASRGHIRFFPSGSATGGRVTLGDGGRIVDVGVDWLTGRVEIGDDRGPTG